MNFNSPQLGIRPEYSCKSRTIAGSMSALQREGGRWRGIDFLKPRLFDVSQSLPKKSFISSHTLGSVVLIFPIVIGLAPLVRTRN